MILSWFSKIDKRYLYVFIGLMVLFPTLWYGIKTDILPQKEKAQEMPIVKFEKVALQEHTLIRRFIGKTNSLNSLSVKSKVAGEVESIHVVKNQFVRKGDLLVSLKKDGKKEALSEAEASLKEAKISFEASRSLKKQGYRSESEFYAELSKLKSAEKFVAIAQENLADTSILAPFDGLVSEISVDQGEVISAYKDNIVYLYDNSKMLAEVHIPEMDTYSIARESLESQLVKVISVGGESFSGKINFISYTADPLLKSHKVEIKLYDIYEEQLTDNHNCQRPTIYLGSTVEVFIAVDKQKAYYVQSSSLGILEGKHIIIKTLENEDTVKLIPVKVIEDDSEGGFWVVPKFREDLRSTLRLITHGQAYVMQGSRVHAIADDSKT